MPKVKRSEDDRNIKYPGGIRKIAGTKNWFFDTVYRGLTIRMSSRTPNRTKAEQYLRRLKNERDEEIRTGQPHVQPMTVIKAVEHYFNNVVKVNAREKEGKKRQQIEDIGAYYGDAIVKRFGYGRDGKEQVLSAVTQLSVIEWQEELRNHTWQVKKVTHPNGGKLVLDDKGNEILETVHYQETSVQRYMNHFRAMQRYAIKKLGVVMPKLDCGTNHAPERIRYFSQDQKQCFLDACQRTSGRWLVELAAFIMGSGLRNSEALALTWRKVRYEKCPVTHRQRAIVSVYAKDSKNGIAHEVPCTMRATEAIQWFESLAAEFIARPPGDGRPPRAGEPLDQPVFVKRDYRDLHRLKVINFWNKQFSKAMHESGLSGELIPTTIHDLRHHFASWAVQRGVKLQRLQKWLGHLRLASTMIYAHLAHGDALMDAALAD